MKHKIVLLFVFSALLIFGISLTQAGNNCTAIQSGQLVATDGSVIEASYDSWGYNYQAHMFNGKYCLYDRNASDCTADGSQLQMKWNDAWLSNKDCDGDSLLDRHYGYPSYADSGAWLTNHEWGTYEQDGVLCEWDYFVKIITPSSNAQKVAGVWYNADGTEIGPEIWGAFAIIQEVENDECAGIEGIQYSSPDHLGFGGWD